MKLVKYLMLTALAIGGLSLTACEKGGDDNGGNGGDTVNPGDGSTDKREQVTGTYPVAITHPLSFENNIRTDIVIALDGRNDLKGSGSANVGILGSLELEIPLSNLKEFTAIDGKTVTGYYFKVAARDYKIAGFELKQLAGSGQYEYEGAAYDGFVWKNATESHIVGHISNGTIWVKLETSETE